MRFRATLAALVLALGLGGYVFWQQRRDRQAVQERAALARLLPVQPAEVVRLGFAYGDSRIGLERREAGWVLVEPVSANCEPEAVASFLDTLAAARQEDNLGQGELIRYGLDHPAALVRIETQTGARHELRCGRINPLQTLVYVQVDGGDDVLLTTSALLSGALTSAFGWRDKRMIDVPSDSVALLRFNTLNAGNLVVRRDPTAGWVTEGPVAWRVDPVRLRGLLLQLTGLRGIGVAAEDKEDPLRFGLGHRKLSVVLEGRNGQVLGDLVLGFAFSEGGYYAVVPDKPEVFEVEGQMVESMVSLVQQPRDRRIFPPFDPAAVTRLEVKAPADTFVLQRHGLQDWKVVASDKVDSTFALDPGRVQALLEQMATLEVTEFPEKQPALVQLVPPQWSVDLYGDNGLLAGLRIGRRDPRGGVNVVAQGLGDRAAFLLAPTVLINLPFDLERLGTGEIEVPVDSQRG